MKIFLISLFLILRFSVFSQQVVNISINQPGVENCFATSSDNQINDYSFKVYPNPADEKLTIELNQSPLNKKYNFILSNILGQTIFLNEEPATNGVLKKEFDISNIPPGMYILKINSSEFKTSEKILVNGNK